MANAELQHLKEIAAKLGLDHSPNIGGETLKGKIKDFCLNTGVALDDESLDGIFSENPIATDYVSETNAPNMTSDTSQTNSTENMQPNSAEIEKLANLTFASADRKHAEKEEHDVQKRAMKLVRCIITCNNPNKRSYTGEIFCVRNKAISMVKKMVPFNVPTHVPQILLNMIREKQLQHFTAKRLPNGIESKDVKLVPEYNIEILPPLTSEEFNAIKQKQLAEGNN